MVYLTIQSLYWLALAIWFGGVLFVGIAAPIVFRTVREANPLLPHVLSVNLENQHAALLAGDIVGNILATLFRIEIVCAAVVLGCLVGQWFVTDVEGNERLLAAIVRSVLFAAAASLMLFDRLVIWPRIWKHRQEYIDHADEPDIANPAKDLFDRYHRDSVTILGVIACLLMGMILFSAGIARGGVL